MNNRTARNLVNEYLEAKFGPTMRIPDGYNYLTACGGVRLLFDPSLRPFGTDRPAAVAFLREVAQAIETMGGVDEACVPMPKDLLATARQCKRSSGHRPLPASK